MRLIFFKDSTKAFASHMPKFIEVVHLGTCFEDDYSKKGYYSRFHKSSLSTHGCFKLA